MRNLLPTLGPINVIRLNARQPVSVGCNTPIFRFDQSGRGVQIELDGIAVCLIVKLATDHWKDGGGGGGSRWKTANARCGHRERFYSLNFPNRLISCAPELPRLTVDGTRRVLAIESDPDTNSKPCVTRSYRAHAVWRTFHGCFLHTLLSESALVCT